jgi:hypothetical protein
MPRLDEKPTLDESQTANRLPALDVRVVDEAPARSEEPRTFDPLDEEYALAPASVQSGPPPAGSAFARDFTAASGETVPLSDEPLPERRRSTRLGIDSRGGGTGRVLKPARFNDPARFTLRNLLLVITMASVVLSIGIRFPRPYFAGAAGLAALVTAVSASWLRGGGAILQLAWWTLLGIYLMACGFALLGM